MTRESWSSMKMKKELNDWIISTGQRNAVDVTKVATDVAISLKKQCSIFTPLDGSAGIIYGPKNAS